MKPADCPKPTPLRPLIENIPSELKQLPHWVGWVYEARSGKWTKPPVNPKTGGYAKSNDPRTWVSFEEALQLYASEKVDGIGFVLSKDDPFTGVDLDHCRDPLSGELTKEAWDIISKLDSYTEASPSGSGVRMFVKGDLASCHKNGQAGIKRGNYEAYSSQRYFTVTGHSLRNKTIEERQSALESFVLIYLRAKAKPDSLNALSASPTQRSNSDNSIWNAIRQSRAWPKIESLMLGELSAYDGDESAADLALCSHFAFWFGPDPKCIEEAFNESVLATRSKWSSRIDYRNRTIEKALEGRTDFYSKHRSKKSLKSLRSPDASASTHLIPIDEAAFHGLAGQIVRAIEPSSEADPKALLIQILVAFGNVVGRSAHFRHEDDVHYLNLYTVLVGETSKARKGVSFGRVNNLFAQLDPAWAKERVLTGLSSGEGLICHIGDEEVSSNHAGRKSASGGLNHGANDKRVLIKEPEFASVLKQTERQGNTLSAMLRQCWDDGNLRTLTKNSPLRATNAHISLVGHITVDELRRSLRTTESTNGFANRILWALVHRSKMLPDGGAPVDLRRYVNLLRSASRFAKRNIELRRDNKARDYWAGVYASLSEGKPGLAGAILGRGEAQTMRLACLFAVLDQSEMITVDQLKAALAIWDYCERSVVHIFGERMGNDLADKILAFLRSEAAGRTRREMRDHFNRHQNTEAIEQALKALEGQGLAYWIEEPTEGRSAQRWFATYGAT